PYDGHTLGAILADMEKTLGHAISRVLAAAGYRGHNAPESHKFRVFTSGQKRRVTPAIKRQMRRRSAIEPVIGHIKAEHRMGRNYLAGKQGDAVNAILAAAGYNFSLLLRWLKALLWLLLAASQSQPKELKA
ncbi:transposase, partial [Mesorhizobium sp. M1393]|uniref:transposase n=1 Tax=Mesorhizobium sp. M1393 TaxID=2957094 RepID=UPI003338AC10